jgi:hypothetical protein
LWNAADAALSVPLARGAWLRHVERLLKDINKAHSKVVASESAFFDLESSWRSHAEHGMSNTKFGSCVCSKHYVRPIFCCAKIAAALTPFHQINEFTS